MTSLALSTFPDRVLFHLGYCSCSLTLLLEAVSFGLFFSYVAVRDSVIKFDVIVIINWAIPSYVSVTVNKGGFNKI